MRFDLDYGECSDGANVELPTPMLHRIALHRETETGYGPHPILWNVTLRSVIGRVTSGAG